ncbi:MAG: exo-beta-N-acetylmuramidase NamZ domain-containing protein [Bryobacteraceae bacterium]
MRALLFLAVAGIVHAPAQDGFAGSARLDAAIQQAIRTNQIPGAVLLVGQNGKVLHYRAYGNRALRPAREAMTRDTVFDAASLTKVVATTSAIMKLVEEGKIRLNDPVTVYLPEFQNGKSEITVRQLLTHFSGLRPDVDLRPVWSGYETGIKLALVDKPVARPGQKFIYSDINFLLLGEIVHRQSSMTLAEYVKATVFDPLGMKETMFQPPASLRGRIAPTEMVNGKPLRGVVHDETTRFMGGIAGHAGIFSTATDLSRFAEMMLNEGELNGVRVFSPATVRKFTTPQSPPDQPILRGLGWDIDSPFSGTRGDLFPIGSYGHTGFTGTSLWIDPVSRSYVILLTNSVHPQRRKPITALRGRVATITASALGMKVPAKVALTGYNETLEGAGIRRVVARNGQTMTGLDVLAAQGFAPLQGKRIGIITNHTGVDREGKRNIDLMRAAGVDVKAIFSPEHGIAGREDHENIGHSLDETTGLPVWSLYSGKNRKPSPEMLNEVDALVFDIQDIGARFYTYISTMKNAMETAAETGKTFYVLDRPNPITGVKVEGPMLDKDLISFVGSAEIPVRHGMTAGELARMFNDESKLRADLHVIAMENWERGDWFDSTGLTWVDPSPNMRSLKAALLYPGIALIESSKNYSVGRGTDAPFEQTGADWVRGQELAAYLNGRLIPGVRVYPTRFRPASSNFAGKLIEGIRFVITDREAFNSTRFGIEVAAALEKLYPGKIAFQANERLIGNRETIRAILAGEDPRTIQARDEEALEAFLRKRERYLIYK